MEIAKYAFPDLPDNAQSYKQVHRYCYQIISGEIPSCKWIKKAAERHFRDLERSKKNDFKYYFDEKLAQRAIDFYKFIKHTKGELAGQAMELMPWQQWIVGSIFGWVTKEKHSKTNKHTRRFKTAEVFVARKNGKSTLASGIGLYGLLADGEHGAEIYSAATTREQARIVFDDACVMLKSSELKEVAKVYQAEIKADAFNAKFKPLSSDANSLDGLNVHMGLVDEIHAHKTREVYDVIETATGARTQPLIFVISTAGTILDGIATELWKYGETILEGLAEDDTFFAALYTTDSGDDFTDPDVWIKANPCLGVSKKVEDMERLANKARVMPSSRSNFLTKHLNVFVSSTDIWLDIDKVKANIRDINIADYKGRDCYIGMDLAQKLDLTAIALLFPNEDGSVDCFFKQYIPEGALEKASAQKQELYRKWDYEGSLEITDGVATDFNYIEEDLRHFNKEFNVISIGYDPYAATQMSIKLTEEGLNMVAVPQNFKNLSEPSKEFETLIQTERLHHNGDGVFVWCCSNTHIKVDHNDNIKPVKENNMSENKIDSVIALITGLSLCVLREPENKSVYEKRDFLFL